MAAVLTEYDVFVLQLLDRAGGSLEKAKARFARSVVRAAVRREGSCGRAADALGVHRNTVSRYAEPRRVRT